MPQEVLKKYFKFNDFRKGQKEVIDTVLKGKSAVVIMPTGGGKSLCYQVPALCLDGVTIVVSPLIALMKDQVDSLQRLNIPATFINSSLSLAEITQRLTAIKQGSFKLLYVAPERFNDPEFFKELADINISLFAIDEAHCISEWGHDFRPSYTRLKTAIKKLKSPPIIALTATATPEVRDDIIRQLDLVDFELFITGFDRPNLNFQVEIASKHEKLYRLLDFIQNTQGSGIVYAGTRNNADEISEILNLHDIKAINYHAGLTPEERKKIQEDFMNNEYDVIVATNAFGMGIDKSDIRFVVHFDMPGTLEAYYQEAGRAGRDGQPANCLLFYHPSDRYLQEFFIKGDNPSRENIKEIYEVLLNYQGHPILMTYAEIKQFLSEQVPEMTIGTALRLLAKHGYIELKRDNQKEAFVKLNYSIGQALEGVGTRAKNKRAVLQHLFVIFDEELNQGVHFNLENIISSVELKKDSYLRALRDLSKNGIIEFQPPFRGKEIHLKKRVDPEDLDLNWGALEKKLANDLEKLNAMEGYVYHPGNKKEYILKYFGEKF